MKILVKAIAVVGILAMVSCNESSTPNYQFFPNMYQSVGYETYSESAAFNNGVAAQLPVDGTIKRGWMPYEVANTAEGKIFAKDSLVSPIKSTEKNLATGKELFGIYCTVCHGKKGKGDGGLVKSEKFLGVPNYKDRDITTGSVYHTIYYGLNSMGSHAGQLNENERWQVAMYVSKLKADLTK
ncbi:MAG: cytochrome C [Kordia sp.]|nr:MAG: cytochrome C [Kordia sp.]